LPDGFSYKKWMQGLNAGRSFVTTGPMLFATFNGRPPGHTFKAIKSAQGSDPDAGSVRVAGSVESAKPLSTIEIIVNGVVAKTIKPQPVRTKAGGYVAKFDVAAKLDGSSWVAVRCWENHPHGRFRFAHTAPVYFDVPGKPLRPKRAEVRYFVRRMQEEIARNKAVLKPAELQEYRKALRIYQQIEKRSR
jgi:hypothetical protein